MLYSDIERQRLEKLAHRLCEQRNQSLPVEHGKAYYELIESGVVFTKAFFLLDSSAPSYSCQVAKIEFEPNNHHWHLYISKRDSSGLQKVWSQHPVLSSHSDVSALMSIVEHDKEDCIWY